MTFRTEVTYQHCIWRFGVTNNVLHAKNETVGREYVFTRFDTCWERKSWSGGVNKQLGRDFIPLGDEFAAVLDAVLAQAKLAEAKK